MNKFSVFDIIGPIMIGPSSSHTAGAARLAKVAKIITAEPIKSVKFYLHGSFAKTYKGHGTDKALVAGILGMDPDDKDLKNSFEIATSQGIDFEFIPTDLGDDMHPNTVKFVTETITGNSCSVRGSSIGGGNILINEVNDTIVDFTGQYPTLIIKHKDVPGIISEISTILYDNDINIASLKVYRVAKGDSSSMIFELDSPINYDVLNKLKKLINGTSKLIIIEPAPKEV